MAKPDLIIKHVYGWSEDYHLTFRPGFCLLGNKAGLEWLATHVANRAAQIDESKSYESDDPDDVEDLWETAPWNQQLSDELHLTLGSYSDRHRKKALRDLNITRKSRLTGPPFQQWAKMLIQMAEWSETHWAANMLLTMEEREQIADSIASLANVAAKVSERFGDPNRSGSV